MGLLLRRRHPLRSVKSFRVQRGSVGHQLFPAVLLCALLVVPRAMEASSLVIQRGTDPSVEQVAMTAFLLKKEATSTETLVPLGTVRLEAGQTTARLQSRIPLDAGARVIAFGTGLLAEEVCMEGPEGRCFLHTRPAGTLELTLATAARGDESALPDHFVARSWQRDADPLESENRVACLRDGPGTWNCIVPTGVVDLRFDLPGYAPSFLWGAAIERSRNTAEVSTLIPGVHVQVGVDAVQATGRLEPLGAPRELSQQRLDFAAQHAKLSSGGLLKFNGVASGKYRLVIESAGRAPFAEYISVERGSRDLELGPIHLQEVGELAVHVTPPLDPSGEPWRVVTAPLDSTRSALQERRLDLYGWGTMSDFRSGRYLVLVRDSSSSVWYSEKQELQSGDTLELSISRVEIEGEISIGSDPLMTTLIFGTTQGTETIEIGSDEYGDFHGFLPHEGEWDVELGAANLGCGKCGGDLGVFAIASLDVEAGPSGKALLTIELPDTHLHGRVVRDDGKRRQPIPGAQVLIIRKPADGRPGRRQGQLWADDDGAFVMEGFEPGSLSLGAIEPSGDGESAWISTDVVEGVDPPDVELVVRSRRDLVARVVGPDGPVAGAHIYAFPEGSLSESEVTDLDGGTVLRVPDGSGGPLLVDVPSGEAIIASYSLSEGSSGPVFFWSGRSSGSIVLEGFDAVPSPAWLMSQGGMLSLNILRNFAPSHVVTSHGRVLIQNLEAGHYQLCLWSQSRCRGVDVVPGGQTEVTRTWLMEAE